MHILLALITAITGLLWILFRLHRAGVDLNSLNPFVWYRKYKWQQQYGSNPLHQLETPLEAVGVILVLTAKSQSDLTREAKQELIQLFVKQLHVPQLQADEFYHGCAYLTRDVTTAELEIPSILKPNKANFTLAQVDSLLQLMESAAKIDGEPSEHQLQIIDAVKKEFNR